MQRQIFLYTISFIFILFNFLSPAFGEDFSSSKKLSEEVNLALQNINALTSISIRDLQTSTPIYEKNSKTLVRPASALKIFTTSVALDYLTKNYKFETGIYRKGNVFYLVLSGDPMFDEQSLKDLISNIRTKNVKLIEEFIIDDKKIDMISWGEGWQWDDNINPLMPKISPYNINHNLIAVRFTPDAKKEKVLIRAFPQYSEYVMGNVKIGKENKLTVSKNLTGKPPVYTLIKGTINSPQTVFVPVSDPADFFLSRLYENLNGYDIGYNPSFKYEKMPSMTLQTGVVSHNLYEIIKSTNQTSDNLAAEVIVKHIGAQFTGKTGTTKDGLAVVSKFYDKLGANTSELYLTDGSGVSYNNLVTTSWMSLALSKLSKTRYFKDIQETMATPSIGTFKGRMNHLEGKIKVKTGTLGSVSSVVGYMTTKSGKEITFAITLQNYKKGSFNPKNIEDKILNSIYNNI